MKIIHLFNKFLFHWKSPTDITKFHNLLVVSNTGLGDTLLSTPAIKSLKKSFPKKKIFFLLDKKISILFKDYSYADEVIEYKSGFINLVKTIIKLKKLKIDTIFLFHSNGPEDIFFSILSGASNILKMTHNTNHEFKDIFYNEPVKKIQHDIECKLDLIRLFNPSIIETNMEISPITNTNNFRLPKNKKLIGLQIGAQDIYKIWPIKNFIKLSKEILNDPDTHIILFGHSNFEQKMTSIYLSEFKFLSHRITNLCSKTTLNELAETINNIDLLISNDTGTMHLAIALKTPTICLFSPTNSQIFGPYQDHKLHKIIQKDGGLIYTKHKKYRDQKAMELISVEEVYEEYLKLIKI